MQRHSKLPSPGMIIGLLALIVALAGTATALPGKNKVDKNDIKKNAVKSKQIKDGQVQTVDLAPGAVAGQLPAIEAKHFVGQPGEPGFENGGDGDCIWSNAGVAGPPGFLEPPSFYKDNDGRVHLSGVVISANGLGGDGQCGDNGGNDNDRDDVAFILPEGYRPAAAEFSGLGPGALPLFGALGASFQIPGDVVVPAGAVSISAPPNVPVPLSGFSFRAATPAQAAANANEAPAKLDKRMSRLFR